MNIFSLFIFALTAESMNREKLFGTKFPLQEQKIVWLVQESSESEWLKVGRKMYPSVIEITKF